MTDHRRKEIGKRERALRFNYGRASVALQRTQRAVDDKLAELYRAMQRRDAARQYYDTIAKRLAKLDR